MKTASTVLVERGGRTIKAGLLACAAAFAGAAALVPAAARADNLWMYSCGWWNNNAPAFQPTWGTPNLTAQRDCQQADKALEMDNAGGSIAPHAIASWYTTSPSGVSIDYAYTPANSMRVSCSLDGAGLEAWWAANGAQYRISQPASCSNGMGDGGEIGGPVPPGQSFQFYVWCASGSSACGSLATPAVEVQGIELGATENGSPSLLALDSNNLFYQGGRWVRGAGWPISLQASDVSGVCDMRAFLNGFNGQLIQGPTAARDQTVWDQCDPSGALQQWPASIDTTGYPNGSALQLTFQAENAALNWSTSATSTSYVDNAPVGLSLSGPSQAPTTAGQQYVTATATAGPSGVGAIMCSADGSASMAQHITGAGTQTASSSIAVSGLGTHQVSCYATNRAIDPSGAPASSPIRTWTVKIGDPVDVGITFAHVIRHCQREVRPVTVPGRWVMVRRHHKWVKIHRHARTRSKRELVCRTVTHDRRLAHVQFGHRVTVSGWLATADRVALGHTPVAIQVAPDNELYRWRTIKVVMTSADGSWKATLPPGPSRVLRAVYGGGTTTLSTASIRVRTAVPAKIVLAPIRSHVPWGGVLVIRGRVLGWHLRPEQVLQVLTGVGRHLHVLGNPNIRRDGRFVIQLAALGSGGPLHTQIAVATLRETNFPYARGLSQRQWVTIG